jgi:hypothetical protein
VGRAFRVPGLAKSAKHAKPPYMRPGLIRTTLRVLAWLCVVVLAVLSLAPGEEIEPLRTDLPGQVEHIIAYAGSGAIAVAGYGLNRSPVRVIGWLWLYAGVLEYLQNFSRPDPGPCGFRGIGLWNPVRRSGRRRPLALALGFGGSAGYSVAVGRRNRRCRGGSVNN